MRWYVCNFFLTFVGRNICNTHFGNISLSSTVLRLRRLYVDNEWQWTDCQRAGGLLLVHPGGKVGQQPLHESVFKRVYDCQICCVDEHNLSFVIVQLDDDPLGLLPHRKTGARRVLSPVRVSVAQADDPETLRRVEEDHALPLDGLPGHADVPVLALAHLHRPAVLSRHEPGGSQHADAAVAPLGVVGEESLAAVLHPGEFLGEAQVGLGRVWIQGDGSWKYK